MRTRQGHRIARASLLAGIGAAVPRIRAHRVRQDVVDRRALLARDVLERLPQSLATQERPRVHPFRLGTRIEQSGRCIDILGVRPDERDATAVLAHEEVLGDITRFSR